MTKLREMFDSAEKAKQINTEQQKQQDETREHIRAKLSETDRQFIDDLREVFPTVRLVGIKFNDGEVIGRP